MYVYIVIEAEMSYDSQSQWVEGVFDLAGIRQYLTDTPEVDTEELLKELFGEFGEATVKEEEIDGIFFSRWIERHKVK